MSPVMKLNGGPPRPRTAAVNAALKQGILLVHEILHPKMLT